MAYERDTQGKSGIVDFRYKDIQNLEERVALPPFWGKAGQIYRTIRHTETGPEVL
jgi:hypothetical protein